MGESPRSERRVVAGARGARWCEGHEVTKGARTRGALSQDGAGPRQREGCEVATEGAGGCPELAA